MANIIPLDAVQAAACGMLLAGKTSVSMPDQRLLPLREETGALWAHWSIENSLHRSLDPTFGTDQWRARKNPRTMDLSNRGHCDKFPTYAELGNRLEMNIKANVASGLARGLLAESPAQLKCDRSRLASQMRHLLS